MIGPSLAEIYHAPMLDEMPDDTTVLIENDGCWGRIMYKTKRCITDREINLCEQAYASYSEPERFIRGVHAWFKTVYDEHWLATYNVWPGWRI
jgi:hypothetical protein